MYTQLFPILTTPDLDRALGFYRDLLGAAVTFEFPGPDGESGYVGLELGSSHLGNGRDPTVELPPGRRVITFRAYTQDCDAAVTRLREAGVTIIDEPTDQPWGERIARVRDPDGNEVNIGAGGMADATDDR
jgi:lactoylglutathione lyase